MNRLPLAVGGLLLLLPLACGDRPRDPKDGAGGRGGASADGGGGASGETCGSPPGRLECINGCVTGHVLSDRVCDNGAWVCPFGTNPTADCAGTGDCPPSGGGACTDGVTGVIHYQQCSNGTWSCPPGTHPSGSAADAGAFDASSGQSRLDEVAPRAMGGTTPTHPRSLHAGLATRTSAFFRGHSVPVL